MPTGKCLCGCVAWEAAGEPTSVHFCHCGMCRRWTGSPFATLAWYPVDRITWKGQTPSQFRSSPIAIRSYCGSCGTPMALTYDGRDEIALTVGTADEAASLVPTYHYGCESRLPWADIGSSLPREETKERW
jgi:hypothetical protein